MNKFDSQRIEQLLRQARELLAQDDVDETTKVALANCLQTVQGDLNTNTTAAKEQTV